jgi:glycosyltransferase involved in cell wall biosynthesis
MKFARTYIKYLYSMRRRPHDWSNWHGEGNIGDAVQCIAVERLLMDAGIAPETIIRINRDALQEYSGEPCILPMQGWFGYFADIFPFPWAENIVPLFVGFHLTSTWQSRERFMTAGMLDKMRPFQPIGCRDRSTLTFIRSLGLDAYLSGCLTLTFPKRHARPENGKVFLVDVPHAAKEAMPHALRVRADESITHFHYFHTYPVTEEESVDYEEKARYILRRYEEEAELVVTSRIHAALPCIAMGIPVVFVTDKTEEERFDALSGLIPRYHTSRLKKVNWTPDPVDVDEIKKILTETFLTLLGETARRHGAPFGYDKPVAPDLTKAFAEACAKRLSVDYEQRLADYELLQDRCAELGREMTALFNEMRGARRWRLGLRLFSLINKLRIPYSGASPLHRLAEIEKKLRAALAGEEVYTQKRFCFKANMTEDAGRIARRFSREQLRRKSGKLNILYFSPVPSHPHDHGNRNTVFQFAEIFQNMGHTLHFGLPENSGCNKQDLAAMYAHWDFFHILPPCPTPVYPEGVPFDGWYDEQLGRAVLRLCLDHDIDVVFCTYIWQSKLLERLPVHILKIIDTHDRMSNRFDMLRANNLPLEFFSCTVDDEAAYLRRADVVAARREEEADFFRKITDRDNVVVLSHIEPPVPVQKRFDKMRHIGLVAGENLINYSLVKDFLRAFAARPDAESCGITIHIAGRVGNFVKQFPEDTVLFQRSFVDLMGFVEDLYTFYASLDIVVAPVTIGTGINVKTVQAMAYGMPLLATACACKGIETQNIHHQYKNSDDLLEGLFFLRDNPEKLKDLAEQSRITYAKFYTENIQRFQKLLEHPKITSNFNL